MNNLLKWIKDNPIRSMFLVPIFLVAGISISHVVAWYDITNPFSWAIYLSVAVEIGAITALIAATQRIKGGVWFMFGLVTFVQLVGNIFYSYKEIDVNGDLFKSWVELMSPIFELFGTEPTDVISHKRWLAILGGGLLPIISLTSLHFFVKYEPTEKQIEKSKEDVITELFNLESNVETEEKVEEPIQETKEEIVLIELEPKVQEEFKEEPPIQEKIKSKRGRKKKEIVEENISEEKKEEPIINEQPIEIKTNEPKFGIIPPPEGYFENLASRGKKLTYTKKQ